MTGLDWDSNVGWTRSTGGSSLQAWMWKRHAKSFDVVTYKADNIQGRLLFHNLGVVPEMIWTKNRDTGYGWGVYHKGLNGGTNPEQYRLKLESDGAEAAEPLGWYDTPPTASQITLGNGSRFNSGTDEHIALLFASVDGLSLIHI